MVEASAAVLKDKQKGMGLESWPMGFPLPGTRSPSLFYMTHHLDIHLNVTSLGKSSSTVPAETFVTSFPPLQHVL